MEEATSQSWKHQPLPDEYARIPFHGAYTPDDFRKLRAGHVPRDMDDKWFIYFDAGVLRFHRSWTGMCTYEVDLQEKDGQFVTGEVRVNRDASQYGGTDDEYDAQLLAVLIDHHLLKRPTEFPLPGDLPHDAPPGAAQHSISGSACPERIVPRRSKPRRP